METTLELLTFDALFLILQKLSPKAILNLCLSSENFERKYCRNQDFWQRLISYFFPNSFHTDNPRDQYRALTEGVITPYYIVDDHFEFDTAYLNLEDPDEKSVAEDEGSFIPIDGLTLDNGTKVWILHYYFDYVGAVSGEKIEEFIPYKTRKNALKASSSYFSLFETEIYEYVFHTIELDVSEEALNIATEKLNLPTPFNENEWLKWLEANDSISLAYYDRGTSLRIELEIMEVKFLHDVPE